MDCRRHHRSNKIKQSVPTWYKQTYRSPAVHQNVSCEPSSSLLFSLLGATWLWFWTNCKKIQPLAKAFWKLSVPTVLSRSWICGSLGNLCLALVWFLSSETQWTYQERKKKPAISRDLRESFGCEKRNLLLLTFINVVGGWENHWVPKKNYQTWAQHSIEITEHSLKGRNLSWKASFVLDWDE